MHRLKVAEMSAAELSEPTAVNAPTTTIEQVSAGDEASDTVAPDDAVAYWKNKALAAEQSAKLLFNALQLSAANAVDVRRAFDNPVPSNNASDSSQSEEQVSIPLHDDVGV